MGRRSDEILRLCSNRRLRIEGRLGGLESRFILVSVQERLEGDNPAVLTFLNVDGTSRLIIPEEEIAGLRPAPGGGGWIVALDGGTELILQPEAGPGA
ncbi:MAG: hypothetical protein ACPLPT_06250 [Moorellales bacterium]